MIRFEIREVTNAHTDQNFTDTDADVNWNVPFV